jgi:peptidoglycan/xylan/chitin deacetylase (PgdA/CDA1 family)
LNIEHFEIDIPSTGFGPAVGQVPDVRNYAWRDYGMRVGIWRVMDILAKYGIRATVALNASVCEHYPVIIEEAKRRGWEFMGHGITNSKLLLNLPEDEERKVIKTTVQVIENAVGKRPEGWLSPALTETFNTLDILAEEGIRYVCDWCNDDQPYPMRVKKGTLISIPYSIEVNDLPVFLGYHLASEQFCQIMKDQFDVLYQEGANSGRVMAIALHPFLIGQPFRSKYLDSALQHIASHPNVWFTTGSEIASWYYEHYFSRDKE